MNIKNPQGRLARWITRLTAFDVEFVYRKGECNAVADCVARNSLAARLANKVLKHDGAHSALNSVAREQGRTDHNDRSTAHAQSKLECCASSPETASVHTPAPCETRGAGLKLEAAADTSHNGRAPKGRDVSLAQRPLTG